MLFGWTAQVHKVAAEAIARARRGDGPTLIEAQTYRFRGHSLADPDELRSKEEKEKWLVTLSSVVPLSSLMCPAYPSLACLLPMRAPHVCWRVRVV